MIKIGINGFGRIGRLALRTIVNRKGIKVVAINDVLDAEYLAYLFKYDSVHGRFKGDVTISNGHLVVNGSVIRVTCEKNPENIGWDQVDVDYVLESGGFFTSKNKAGLHLKGGAKNVAISAPSKDAPMFVMGVNHRNLKSSDVIFSNASCTTNCIAPMAKVLHEKFEIEEAFVSTVHSTTSGQKTVDGAMDNWRRGRSALVNIIPTTTSASTAVVKIMPELQGKLLAMAFRVPTADVSLVDLTVKLKKATNYETIKKVMRDASNGELKGILGYTEDPVVSQDFVSEVRTSVFDASAGIALNDHFFKLIAWYDNEFGYANKIVDLIQYAASLDNK